VSDEKGNTEPSGSEPASPEPGDTETDVRALRIGKLDRLRAEGVDPYPRKFQRDHTIGEVREQFPSLEAGEETDVVVRVAGRIMLMRGHGKLVFATIRDRSGSIQLFLSQSETGKDQLKEFETLFDIGDWVGVEGTVIATKRGELSVKVSTFELLSKALRPLPDKWAGLSDVDTRYRQRYVDLIVNDDARRIFNIRFEAINAIRNFFHERGYIEVETPVLSTIQGGATAKPFITHYNALDIDTYLRIALELHLKRLIVGGLERVYELGRVFRNEGIDTRHNPEFTMLEAYEAFADYHDMMDLTEDLVTTAARAALGTTTVTIRGNEVDLANPWPRVSMVELIKREVGVDINPAMPVDEARTVLDGLGLTYKPEWGAGKLTNEIYDRKVQFDVVEPTFVIDHPREVSPLAKAKPDDPTIVERFELIVDGRELANAYSELNDPIDQLERFENEAKAKEEGDPEAGDVDVDYVRALEYGMPPTGGMGIGIDRLIMVLANVGSIREVILFPTLRPEAGGAGITEPRVYSPDDADA
jgi:lysyl-tRNA synthetase class 2